MTKPAEDPRHASSLAADLERWHRSGALDQGPPPLPQGPLRVLVVEDDPDDRLLVRESLEDREVEVEVEVAREAKAGLAAADAGGFDCIVLDLQLPGMRGSVFLETLREREDLTPVVVLTGAGTEEEAVQLLKAGASDYITKRSMDKGRLYLAVLNAVNRERYRSAVEEAADRWRNELVRLNTALRDQSARLEATHDRLERFAGAGTERLSKGTAEVREALSALLDSLTLDEHPALREEVASALEALEALDRLARDLTTFALVHQARADRRPVALGPIVDEVVAELRPQLLETDVHVDRGPLPEVAGDPELLRAVFRELLENAARFGGSGVRVIVEAEEEVTGHRVEVRDDGPGIPSAGLESVFTPFSAGGQRDAGPGLGLALCHHVLEEHRGSIKLAPAPEGGLSVVLWFPREGHPGGSATPNQ